MQEKRAGHAGQPERRGRDGAEPVGQKAAEYVPDRRGRAEHQQCEADVRGVETQARNGTAK